MALFEYTGTRVIHGMPWIPFVPRFNDLIEYYNKVGTEQISSSYDRPSHELRVLVWSVFTMYWPGLAMAALVGKED